METEEEIQNVNVHHGHNIRRTRIEKNIKQDALAALVNMTQPNVSKYEKMRVIEDEMLNRFARALVYGRYVQYILFQNCTFCSLYSLGVQPTRFLNRRLRCCGY